MQNSMRSLELLIKKNNKLKNIPGLWEVHKKNDKIYIYIQHISLNNYKSRISFLTASNCYLIESLKIAMSL